jgi:hypothetical protein
VRVSATALPAANARTVAMKGAIREFIGFPAATCDAKH